MSRVVNNNILKKIYRLTIMLILFCIFPFITKAVDATTEFNYTGEVQKYIVQSDGLYKLEVWGAAGGNRGNSNHGLGGYTSGTTYLHRGDVLYVYVGGNGNTHQGWNGGGYQSGLKIYGGGATDIRFKNGNWNDQESLLSRIIVGGGGGSNGSTSNGGGVGGYNGGSTSGYGSGGVGGTQTSAGSIGGGFGYGGAGNSWSGGHAGAGGGGWYGGGGSTPDGSGDDDRAGGGGSSFNWNSATKNSVPAGYSVKEEYFLTNVAYTSGTRKGDGLAKITALVGDGIEEVKINNGDIRFDYNNEIYNYSLTVDNDTDNIEYTIKGKQGFTITQSNSNSSFANELTLTNVITVLDNSSGNIQIYNVKVNKQNYYIENRDEVSYGYSYTGDYQLFYVPATGIYTLETWGAQGGHRGSNNGGKGGYSTAHMYLVKGEVLYVYVGGSGNTLTANGKQKGYNGGGYVRGYNSTGGVYSESLNIYGGGASDIRYGGDSLYNRIMVAGGGGSVGATGNEGGYGGGSTGGNCNGGYGTCGIGGTQTSGGTGFDAGKFGQGGDGYAGNGGYGGAGGGGWYGGGGSSVDGSGDDDRSGAGGSGYIFTESSAKVDGYLLTDKNYLTDAKLYAGNQSFKSPSGSNETGHTGDGYVRISPYLINGVSSVTINDGEIPIDFEYTTYDYSLSILDTVENIKVSFEVADGYSKKESYIGTKDIRGMKIYEYSVDVTNDITGLIVTYHIAFNKQSSYLEDGSSGSYGYKYTGLPQKFIAPTAGIYTFEAWGAQGGHRGSNNGGRGGYTKGELFLNKGQILYVYVGSNGNNGGWNGGGRLGTTNIYGGGASDIRLGGQSLDNRILVAGGGGSVGASSNAGGYGGGLTGGNCEGSYGTCGNGGTQTSGGTGYVAGTYGQGGNGYAGNGGYGGAGGGGWYGGGGSSVDGSGDDDRSGAGGSGYIWSEEYSANVPSTYLVSPNYYMSETKILSGNQQMPSKDGETTTGNTGDGYVRISFALEFDYEIIVSDNVTLDKEFDYDIKDYNGTVDKNSSQVEFTVTDSEAILNVTGDGKQDIHVGDNTYNIAITYINGAVEVFNYNIPRESNDIDYLNNIYFDNIPISELADIEFDKDKTTYNVTLPYYMDEYDLTVDKGSADQIITNIGHIQNKNNKYTIPISVTNETGTSTKVYTLNVTVPHSSKMKKLSFVSNAGTKLEFNIPRDETEINIEVESYLAALYATAELYDSEAEAEIVGDGYIESDDYQITITVKEPHVDDTVYHIIMHRITASGYEKDATYTGSVQKVIIPYSHEYLLEVWGAQGGKGGGAGGYSHGKVYLEKGTTVYLYAGGSGANGGFNGGGSSKSGYGGGASDIRITTDSLYSRVIVAGGGGGHGSDGCASGGVGGGTKGGGSSSQGSCGIQAGGGTQTDSGTYGSYGSNRGQIGSFGKGADAPSTGGSYYGGAGGGGWYGGGSGATAGWSNGGGGGSGFVYTKENAQTIESDTKWLLDNRYYLKDAETKMGSDLITSPSGTETYGNTGNGYARISIPYQESENDFLNLIQLKATNTNTEEIRNVPLTPIFDRETKDYYIELDSNETTINLAARPEDSKATINGLGEFDVPKGTTDYTITVTAEAGNIKTYTVHITRQPDTNPYPNDITVSGLVPSLCSSNESYCLIKNSDDEITEFNKDTHTYYLTVPSRIKQLYLTVDPGHVNQTVSGEGKVTLNGGENQFTITILSESASTKEESELIENVDYTVYNYIIYRDMNGNNDLEEFKVIDPQREFNYDPDITEYYVSVPNEYTEYEVKDNDIVTDYSCSEEDTDCTRRYVLQIYAKTDDPNANYTVIGPDSLSVGNNQITVLVTAANKEEKGYILNVYREANENIYLSNIEVSNNSTKYEITPEFNKIIQGPYYVTVPNEIDKVDITATPEVETTIVTGTGEHNLVTNKTNIIDIISTAENGTVQAYHLYITREKNNNSYLSDISVDGYQITPTFKKDIYEYTVDVPKGTTNVDITAIPEVDTTTYRITNGTNIKVGKNIKKIIATAENGSTREYILTINRPASDDNYLSDLKTYTNGTIEELIYEDTNGNQKHGFEKDINNYTINVDNSISSIKIEATPNDSFAIISGTGNYSLKVGTNKITIKVQSETNEIREYTITVTRRPNENAYLKMITTDYGIIIPTFDKENNTYTVNVPNEVETINIIATPEVKTTTITGDGTKKLTKGENNFSIVTLAEDKITSMTYNLKVVRDKSSDTNLSNLYVEEGILDPLFNKEIINYEITIPYDKTEINVHATPEDKNASYEVIGNSNLQVGENEVKVIVTSESNETKEYTINVIRQEQEESNNYLSNILITSGTLTPEFNKEQLFYEVSVPYDIGEITVSGILSDQSSTITGNGKYNLKVGQNLVGLKVTGSDSKTRDYQLLITREQNTDARLSNITIKNTTLNPTFNRDTYEYNIDTTSNKLEFSNITTNDPNATYEIINNNLSNGSNTVIIRVTAANKVTTKDYILHVNKTVSKNNYLSNLVVEGYNIAPTFNKNTTIYNLTIPNNINTINIIATPEDNQSTITGDGIQNVVEGTNYFKIDVVSESGETKTYTIIINKEYSDNNYIGNLIINNGTLTPEFNKNTNTYNVEVEYDETQLDLNVILENQNATYKILNNRNFKVGNNTVTIEVTAPNGSVRNYTINVLRKDIVSSLLKDIQIDNYELNPLFDSYIYTYTLNVSNETNKLDLLPITLDKNATYRITGNDELFIGNNQINIEVTSSNGIDKQIYTINVNRQPYANNYLDYLYTDKGDLTPVFNKNTLKYNIEVEHEVDKIELFGEPVDKSNKITTSYNNIINNISDNSLGIYNLITGDNKIYINVTSNSGITRTYIINVNRKKNNNNYLSSLIVKNGTNTYELNPFFDKKIIDYNLTVPADVNKITIDATPEVDSSTINGLQEYELKAGLNEIKINVTAEDGSIRTYTINVTREASSVNKLLDIVPSSGTLKPEFSYYNNEYYVSIDPEINTLSFTVSKEDPNSKVEGIEEQYVPVGESTRIIKVIAENSDEQEYIIHISKESANTKLQSLSIKNAELNPTFNPETDTYYITVPNNITEITSNDITAIPQDNKATVSIPNKTILETNTDNILEITVTAGNGVDKSKYTIHITREKSYISTIDNLKVNIGSLKTNFSKDELEYEWYVPKNTILDQDSVTVTATDKKAIVDKTNYLEVQKNKDNLYEIKVTSEDLSTVTTYKLHVYPILSNDSRLSHLSVSEGLIEPVFSSDTYEYIIHEYVDTEQITINAVTNDEFASIRSGTGIISLNDNTTINIITITAEDGTTSTYTFKIIKDILKDKGLNNISINGLDKDLPEDTQDKLCIKDKCNLNPSFDSEIIEYSIKVPYEYNLLDLSYEKQNEQQKVEISINSHSQENNLLDLGDNKVEVKVYDGLNNLTRTYIINIERCKSNNTYLSSIEIKANGSNIEYEPIFDKHTQEYTVYIDKDVDEVELIGIPEEVTSTATSNGYNYLLDGENQATITVKSQDNSSRVYIIHIIKSGTYNSYIKNITVSTGIFHNLTPSFKQTTFEYTTKVPANANTVAIEAVPVDSTTTISGTGEYEIKTGINEFTLTAISSKDGSISIYKITVIKESSTNVNLSSLSIEEGTLNPEFEKGRTSYNIDVDSDVERLTIHATPEESTSTIKITGNENLITGINIVNIIVTREDKTASKTYQIKVNKKASSNNDLSNIIVKDNDKQYTLTPSFDKEQLSYNIDVPYNIDKVTIEAIKENSYSNVIGDGEEYLNYGNNVKNITVTAENGEIKVYTLNIYRNYNLYLSELITDNYQLTPNFNKETNNYVINVPNDIDTIKITGIKETTSKDVTVTGNNTYELNTGDNEINISVNSIDNHSNNYKIIVNREASNNNYLSSLTVSGIMNPIFDKETNTYEVNVRNNITSLSEINYTTEVDTSTVEIIGNNNFTSDSTNTVIIRVTAEDKSIRDYILNVNLRDDDYFSNRLRELKISEGKLTPDFDPDINNYAVTVSNSIDKINIFALPETERSIVTGDGDYNLEVGRNIIKIKVTSVDGLVNEYNITIYRNNSNDATLESLTIKDHNYLPIFSKLNENYSLDVDSQIDSLDITAIPTDSSSTVKIIGNDNFKSGTNIITIKVTAPDKITTKIYTITVNKTLSRNNYLKQLSVNDYQLDREFNKEDQGPYTINVPYNVNSININAIPESNTSIVNGDGTTTLNSGKNIKTISVTSESGDTRNYTLIINKQPSNDSSLKNIIISDEQLNPVFNKDTFEYEIQVPEELEQITITGIPSSRTSTVEGNKTYNIKEDFTVNLIVTAEDKTTSTYKVHIKREIKANSYLKTLIVKNGELYPSFHKLINNYTILVPYEITSLDMIYTPENENANIIVTGNENFKVGTNKVIITVTAEDDSFTNYELNVIRQPMSSNYLKDLSVEGYEIIPIFEKDNLYYELTVPEFVETVNIKAIAEDPTSKVTGTGITSITTGENIKYVKVESSSGVIRTYQIKINKVASSENYLLTLTTDIGSLSPTFDKTINTYTLTVPEKTNKLTLDGTSSPNTTITGLGTYDVTLGTTTRLITVTSQSGDINTYTINVIRPASNNVNLKELIPSTGSIDYSNDKEEYDIEVEDSTSLISFIATPEDSDAKVITDDIKILDYGNNVYHIKVIAEDKITEKNITINITRKKDINEITTSKDTLFIDIDEEESITYKVIPEDTSYPDIKWISEDSNIATVNNNGLIKGINYGSTTIKVVSTHNENIYKQILVTVMSKKILSDVYEIGRTEGLDYIIGLEPKTIKKEFIKNIKNEETMIHVYDKENNEIDDVTNIGTGFKVKYIYNDNVLDELTIIVRGDLNGDGDITATDYVKMKNYIQKKVEFNKTEFYAGDLTNSNTIVATDYVKMKNYISKKISSVNPK